jgi:hypothetical protein
MVAKRKNHSLTLWLPSGPWMRLRSFKAEFPRAYLSSILLPSSLISRISRTGLLVTVRHTINRDIAKDNQLSPSINYSA